MNPMTSDSMPVLKHVDPSETDFSQFTALALAVTNVNGLQIIHSNLVKLINSYCNLDLNSELSKWPDFTAKAGEVIEVPVSIQNLTRIFLVGIGDQTLEDFKKAATTIARKVKGSGNILLTALTLENTYVTQIATSMVISNYQYSLKSDNKSKTPTIIS